VSKDTFPGIDLFSNLWPAPLNRERMSLGLIGLQNTCTLIIKSTSQHMEINERFIKLSSRLPFQRDIQLGEDITVTIEGTPYIANCVKIESKTIKTAQKTKSIKGRG
jgi:hypothetical protein